MILDNDNPGSFQFSQPIFDATQQYDCAKIKILRKEGACGKVAIEVKTEDGTAISG